MKIIVCGSRDYKAAQIMFDYLDAFSAKYGVTDLIEGGARGADRCAWTWAVTREVDVHEYPAAWDIYGKAAGGRRNQQMINQNPDAVIAFFSNPEKPSLGTLDCIARAKAAGIKVYLASELLK